jgi:hypothetical protein
MIASTLSISSPDQRFSDEETRAHLGSVHGAVHETRRDMLRQGHAPTSPPTTAVSVTPLHVRRGQHEDQRSVETAQTVCGS